MATEAVRKGLWWLPNVQWHYWVVAGARCEDHKEIQGQRVAKGLGQQALHDRKDEYPKSWSTCISEVVKRSWDLSLEILLKSEYPSKCVGSNSSCPHHGSH